METEIDLIVEEIASELRRLDNIHDKVCSLASKAVKLVDAKKSERHLADLDLLSQALRRALQHLRMGAIKTSYFAATVKE